MLLARREVMAGASGLIAFVWGWRASAAAPERIAFDMLYKSFGVRGLAFSDRLLALRGSQVEINGYLAPPLKAESTFFVLTREPMALCPFCQSDAEWPADIVVVYTNGAISLAPAGSGMAVTGKLAVGSFTDPETGFVSQIRIEGARARVI